jgi:hypothetical protein
VSWGTGRLTPVEPKSSSEVQPIGQSLGDGDAMGKLSECLFGAHVCTHGET